VAQVDRVVAVQESLLALRLAQEPRVKVLAVPRRAMALAVVAVVLVQRPLDEPEALEQRQTSRELPVTTLPVVLVAMEIHPLRTSSLGQME
jgi:hypothetical protein